MFIPDTDLNYGTTHTFTLTKKIKDMTGNSLLADFSWPFITQNKDGNGGDKDGGRSSGGICYIDTLRY
jgi:hypothetical protein